MNLKDYKNTWVFMEMAADNKCRNVGLELLREGKKLADVHGEKIVAVVIGKDIDEALKQSAEFGADEIIAVQGDEYEKYNTDAYTYAMMALLEKYKPSTILIGATNNGRDLGPRVACRVGTGLTADCTGLSIDDEKGDVAWTRPAFGGNLMATILCSSTRPQIGTVRPGVFKKGDPEVGRTAPITKEDIKVPADKLTTTYVKFVADTMTEKVNLQEAEIIVSGGRGVGGPEGFSVIRDLAAAMGATVGSSRAAVDNGWIPYAHQVGQTGKTVSPKIYVACGISGAIQHLAGMSSSDTIIAINKDADAPIFGAATYGIVGDLFEVVPALTDEIKKSRA